jgi:MFS family permease
LPRYRLPWAVAAAPPWGIVGAALAKGLQGFGFGVALTAGILYAKTKSPDDQQILAVARFTAMFMVPTFFGPALGEWLLDHYGRPFYFAGAALPMALAAALIGFGLPRELHTPAAPDRSGYLRLARDRGLWLPNMAVAISGMGYGFAVSFLPLMLAEQAIPVAVFFSPFAVVLLTTRFVGLHRLQRLPVAVLTAIGLGAYAASLVLLAGAAMLGSAAVFAAGCGIALGYAVMHPATTEWSSRRYPAELRALPVALINTSFHLGSIRAVQLTGWALPALGWRGVLSGLAAISSLALVWTGVDTINARRGSQIIDRDTTA